MKILAFYLPQFHSVPENDRWWGEGYTEWTAVKRAEPLFHGHYQPHRPLNDNYYNLLDKKTMKWQADLMKEYGIDGLCIYHYWFKDGKKILEKPVENLLRWKDIEIPYCFCWANESWVRTWSNVRDGNAWGDKFETHDEQNDNGILLQQSYGFEKEWKEHFDYLIPFFSDDRYLKIDNKPVFVIYKPSKIPCFCQMRDYWNELAQEQGYMGVSFILSVGRYENVGKGPLFLQRSPGDFDYLEEIDESGVKFFSYDRTWERLLGAYDESCFYTGFVSYDDTPRKGKYGSVFVGSSPQKFEYYLKNMLKKSEQENKELVFLNAWNEWGEGMYLEPDEENGYKMLMAVKNAKESYKESHLDDMCLEDDNERNETIEFTNLRHNLELVDRWLYLKEIGINIDSFLILHEIRKVVVYGYGLLGRHLIRELDNSEIEVCFVADKNSNNISTDCKVIFPDRRMNDADAIIVTPVNHFEEIYEEMKNMGINKKIINLEQILMEA